MEGLNQQPEKKLKKEFDEDIAAEILEQDKDRDDKYSRESFRGLFSMYRKILENQKDDILGHEYTSVVGDDKSARLPCLIIGRTINKIYSKINESKVPILFIDPHNYLFALGNKNKIEQEKLEAMVKELFLKSGITRGGKC